MVACALTNSVRSGPLWLVAALWLSWLPSIAAAQLQVDPDASETGANVETPQQPATNEDADSAIDEAPVDLPPPAAPSGGGSETKQAEPDGEEAFSLPPPEVMAKLPMFVTAFAKTTLTLQNPYAREKVDKWTSDTFLGILFAGQVTKNFGVTAAIFGLAMPKVPTGDSFTTGQFLDFLAVARWEPTDEFNVWLGHVPVPSDRSALSTPFFMPAWKYPGEVTPGAFPIAPKTATFAGVSANNGPTVWGQLGKGKFKYMAGAYLQDPEGTPIFIGRLTLNVLNPEPGFLHASQYYGARGDILAIGASVQSQRLGSFGVGANNQIVRADYIGGNVDLLFEKKLGSAGVFDFEAAAYTYQGDYERFDYSGFALISYLFPFRLGYGKPQLFVRYQAIHQKEAMGKEGEMFQILDLQFNYIVKGDFVKAALGYTRWMNDSVPGNAVFLGLQVQK